MVEVGLPLLGALLTGVCAVLLDSWAARRNFGLLAVCLTLATGSVLTGAAWATIVAHDSASPTGTWSWPHISHAFTAMTLAVLFAALAPLLPALGLMRVFRAADRAGRGGVLVNLGVVAGLLVLGMIAAYMAFIYWFGAVSW